MCNYELIIVYKKYHNCAYRVLKVLSIFLKIITHCKKKK